MLDKYLLITVQMDVCVPREDYADFMGCKFGPGEVQAGIIEGIWPPGLIFTDGVRCWLVWGSYGRQRLVNLWGRLRI